MNGTPTSAAPNKGRKHAGTGKQGGRPLAKGVVYGIIDDLIDLPGVSLYGIAHHHGVSLMTVKRIAAARDSMEWLREDPKWQELHALRTGGPRKAAKPTRLAHQGDGVVLVPADRVAIPEEKPLPPQPDLMPGKAALTEALRPNVAWPQAMRIDWDFMEAGAPPPLTDERAAAFREHLASHTPEELTTMRMGVDMAGEPGAGETGAVVVRETADGTLLYEGRAPGQLEQYGNASVQEWDRYPRNVAPLVETEAPSEDAQNSRMVAYVLGMMDVLGMAQLGVIPGKDMARLEVLVNELDAATHLQLEAVEGLQHYLDKLLNREHK